VRITVLGSGTSHGIPMIGCRCAVCTSEDPRNRRTRSSAAVQLGRQTLLIDAAPELRLQAVGNGIDRIDAVAFTHAHADHVMGFDDLRRFAELAGRPLPVYASPSTLARLYRIFDYALTEDARIGFGIPIVEWHAISEPVELNGHRLTPVPLEHGVHRATGFRIDAPDGASLAWCPDCCGIPPESADRLRGLDVLFLDALRHRPHPTHFTVAEAVEAIRDLAPRKAWLIHMTHDLDHAETEASLPEVDEVPGGIRLACDGLVVDVDS
jgi:phosphoribosyl 1,2-cyclic phosphate phosphodiesterase